MLLQWLRVAHFVGLTLWMGGLMSLGLLLLAGKRVKAAGILADVGSTLSIVSGIYNATSRGLWSQGWLHLKLALVLLLVVVHIMLRIKTRKETSGGAKALIAGTIVLATAVIYVVEMR